MDPMEAAEAELIRKEEEELNDVREAIGLEDFLSKRDFSDRGRDVVTSGKQWQQVQTIAKALHLKEYRNIQASAHKKLRGGFDDDLSLPPADFNLLDRRRVLLREGPANKREPDGKLWKTSRKYIFLFNDLVLICSKRERKSPDEYDLQEVIGMNELRVVNLAFDENEDPAALELAASRRGQRVREGTVLSFSSEAEKSEWMREIVNTSFAFHLSNKSFARQLGWQHEIVQGTAHSAAYLGDAALLRKVIRTMERRGEAIDIHDESGMCPIHWAVLRGHESCLRILLDKGADIDVMNTGLNTPLLLAVCKGYDSIARLLLDKGADLFIRNLVDKDCVMMAVLFGHSSKGLPWVLQLLNSRGLDLNHFDANGATPLHMCASKNLPRPVRMLVDAGADVNCLHQRTQLTPLQMACSHARPDVETIRSFLDKGAYANWRDLQGRTAFDIVLQSCRPTAGPDGAAGGAAIGSAGASGAMGANLSDDSSNIRESFAMPVGAGGTQEKYANLDVTLTRVGDVAVYCLPVLLEIAKKGGRFAETDLDFLRRSFKEAIVEARTTWNQKREPNNFGEFVLAREQAGEELRTSKTNWADDGPVCQLCAGVFGISLRRHHCRACGGLVCEICSTKRLLLSVINDERALQASEALNAASGGKSPSVASAGSKEKEKDPNELYLESKRDRVCDGCFVRLCFEASQPSPDHFRVRQLKICADDLVKSLMSLVEALEDPDGSEGGASSAVANRASLPPAPDASPTKSLSRLSLTRGASSQFSSPKAPAVRSAGDYVRSNEALIEAIRVRDEKLVSTEHLAKKFLEASDGYHRIAKKLIEEKTANSRLWGASGAAATPGSTVGSP